MRVHLKHLLMCAPMIAVGGLLLASGAGAASLLPILGCVLMMMVMMRAMGRQRDGHR